ncbi:transcript variant X2 [Nothobranchius furzeri]|uniref:Transcript variant X2 n=1 Tax=Nothobranchius furzeri TaxID=105023 RepID=A0A9D2Y995_NOTFU|nr:glucagon b isoform X2 [Nothobranchius furzeri]KAF7215923.1 transcript variant X2 [Nothobranchius furzeri]
MRSAQSLAGVLLLILIQSSWQVPVQDADRTSGKYLETRRAQDFVQWLKNSKRNGSVLRRHADGTYTSDVSSYLQDQAAKEFVSWLKTGRGRRD